MSEDDKKETNILDPEMQNIKRAEWRGYTLKALEDIKDEIHEMKETQEQFDKKMDNLDSNFSKEMRGLKVKVAGISATVGIISALVISMIV